MHFTTEYTLHSATPRPMVADPGPLCLLAWHGGLSMICRIAAASVLFLLGGCMHWGHKIAAAECTKAGMAIGTPDHADCVNRWRREDRERATAPFRELFTLGGAIDTRSDEERAIVACEQSGWPSDMLIAAEN